MEIIKKFWIYFTVATLSFVIAFMLIGKRKPSIVVSNTTTIVRDTIRDSIPVPMIVRKMNTKTISLPVHDTLYHTDSVYVDIPISQKVYKDSSYRIVISGYDPNLDSVEIYRKTIYHTKTISILRKSKLNFGIQGGYGITLHGFSPYVGIGIQYNIW